MGHLVNGEWEDGWIDTQKSGGKFRRSTSGFRNWITADGSAGLSGTGGFRAESGRYHLYVSYACPWAHRTLIFRQLKGLSDHISVDVVHPDMMSGGWSLDANFPGATGDSLFGKPFLRDIYTQADPEVSGRVTVPILWDKQTNTIVSNESAEIIRMFNCAFNDMTGNSTDFWPSHLQEAMEPINERIYSTFNNGVYKSGFATTQAAYDEAVTELFDTLDWLDTHLQTNRYLMGNTLTEADWRLFPTLIRFDPVYHTHFKCNRKWLREYKSLWNYTLELYQWPGVADTVNLDHIIRHYHYSHETINPHRLIPINPVIDYGVAHGRGSL